MARSRNRQELLHATATPTHTACSAEPGGSSSSNNMPVTLGATVHTTAPALRGSPEVLRSPQGVLVTPSVVHGTSTNTSRMQSPTMPQVRFMCYNSHCIPYACCT